MPKNKWVVAIAVAVALITGIWIYRIIYPPEPPHVEIANQALDAAKQENADMRRRIDELGKRVKQGAKQIKIQQREKVDAMPPDAVAVAVIDELRLFLDSEN